MERSLARDGQRNRSGPATWWRDDIVKITGIMCPRTGQDRGASRRVGKPALRG